MGLLSSFVVIDVWLFTSKPLRIRTKKRKVELSSGLWLRAEVLVKTLDSFQQSNHA